MSLNKGLVGHWPLDKESLQSATIFADKTPNENRGTSANAPVFTTDRMGQADRAMSFDGVSDYVDCGNDESLQFGGKNEISISVWVYIEGLTGTDQEIIRQDSGYYVRITNSRQVYWKTYTSNEITTDDTITLKTWTHILSIYDGVNMKVYINGVLSKSVSSTGNIGSSTNIIQIASALGGTLEFFNGSLADVRIYNRALSQQEITTLYDSYRPKISLGSLAAGCVLDLPMTQRWSR